MPNTCFHRDCKAAFNTVLDLILHIEVIHLGKKSWLCIFCLRTRGLIVNIVVFFRKDPADSKHDCFRESTAVIPKRYRFPITPNIRSLVETEMVEYSDDEMSVEFRLSEIGSIPSRADLVDTEMTDASDDETYRRNSCPFPKPPASKAPKSKSCLGGGSGPVGMPRLRLRQDLHSPYKRFWKFISFIALLLSS